MNGKHRVGPDMIGEAGGGGMLVEEREDESVYGGSVGRSLPTFEYRQPGYADKTSHVHRYRGDMLRAREAGRASFLGSRRR